MALPQPTNVPRIIEVLDPGANQLSVEVRMPPQLASKYPDKAWGTAIDTIGLQKKDSDRFVGYTLVDIQPMRDSDDLKWIFEKLSGPVWTTTTVGSENIIPEKFRSQVSQTKTKQEVAPGTSPSAITGDLISSTVEAQENTGKAVKVDVSETIDAAATAMVSPSLEDQLYVTTEILVAEGTLPDTGTGVVESTVQAIGKGKAVKTSKFAVTAYTNKTTYTVGYASLLNENVGSADSIPAKFRALKSLKTWRLRVQASAPPSTPALGVGSGDYSGYDIVERAVKQTQENGSTDVFELVIVGLSNTGSNTLDSTTYGKIVTTTTTETLDLSAQTIDTGLAVISSMVEELGNGMTLKSTEQVQGGAWPDPVEQEIVSDATKQPPARYLRDLIRTTVKKMVSAVGSGTLTGNQVAKSYKRLTPDRLEESVTTESLTLSTTAIDEDVQQKPFVKITSVMTPGAAKVLPAQGNGSAKLVYEQGTTQIWENTEEVAAARPGTAGQEKDKKPFVEIVTDKKYAVSPAIATSSGSANIIFNDGVVQVYEVSEVTSTGRYGAAGAEQQAKPFVKITSTKEYAVDGVLAEGAVGSSNKIYDDGTTMVYEKTVETAVAREGSAGKDKDKKPFVEITTDKRYSTSDTIATASGSANIVFNDGTTQVYEISETTSTGRYGAAGAEQQIKPFVKITSTKTYEPSGVLPGNAVGSSNKVYDDGLTEVYEQSVETAEGRYGPAGAEQQTKPFVSITSTKSYEETGLLVAGEVGTTNKIYDDGTTEVYEKSVETAQVREGPAGSDKEAKPFVSIQTDKRYATDPTINTTSGSANLIFNDGTVQAYEVSEVTATAKLGAAGTEQQAKPFVKITSTKEYAEDGVLADGAVGSSNKIYDDGTTTVYEKTVETAAAKEGPAGKDKDEKPFVRIVTDKRYSADPTVSTTTGSANIVFNDGTVQVYEVNEVTAVAKPGEAGQEKDEKPYVTIKTDKRYDTSNTVSTKTGASNKIYDDGDVKVFEINEVTAVAKPGAAGTETDQKPFVKLQTVKTYEATDNLGEGEVGSTNKIYDDGTTEVYEKSVVNATAREGLKGVETSAQQWGAIKSTTNYTTNSTPPLGSSTQIVYTDGAVSVYEQTDSAATINGTTKDIDNQQWGFITWNGTYSSTLTTTQGDKGRQVWSNGVDKVFLNESPTLTIKGTPFTSAVEKNPLYTSTEKSTYADAAATPTDNSSSRLVYTIGDQRVFENTEISAEPTPGAGRTFNTVVEYAVPSVLKSISWYNLYRKGGGLDTLYRPVVEEGFSGFIPAKVIEKFEKVPSGPTKPIIDFRPTPVFIPTPFGNLNIAPTLHAAIPWSWYISSDHPTYYPYAASYVIPATNHVDWKGKGDILVAYKSEPFKDGFITREVYVTL